MSYYTPIPLPITATSPLRSLSSESKVAVVERLDCTSRSLICNLITDKSWRGGGGVDGTPPRSFWFVAVFWNAFTFSGKPIFFLTRWGIFKGWWLCWRILPRIRNQVKVFRYSFSEATPIFLNRLKSVFFLSDRYKSFTSNWLWIEICGKVVLRKIDITMTTINKKLWNW